MVVSAWHPAPFACPALQTAATKPLDRSLAFVVRQEQTVVKRKCLRGTDVLAAA
jgi:hypothetical protein